MRKIQSGGAAEPRENLWCYEAAQDLTKKPPQKVSPLWRVSWPALSQSVCSRLRRIRFSKNFRYVWSHFDQLFELISMVPLRPSRTQGNSIGSYLALRAWRQIGTHFFVITDPKSGPPKLFKKIEEHFCPPKNPPVHPSIRPSSKINPTETQLIKSAEHDFPRGIKIKIY